MNSSLVEGSPCTLVVGKRLLCPVPSSQGLDLEELHLLDQDDVTAKECPLILDQTGRDAISPHHERRCHS